MICPSCKAEINDSGMFCPQCGVKLETAEGTQIEEIQKEIVQADDKKHNFKKIAVIVSVTVAAVIAIIIIMSVMAGTLSDDEKWALESCEYLKDHLLDPDSFVLYEDAIILTKQFDGEEKRWLYIHYGGRNGYGGMTESTAGFNIGGYLCEVDEDFGKLVKENKEAMDMVWNYHDVTWYFYGMDIDGEITRISKDLLNEKLAK